MNKLVHLFAKIKRNAHLKYLKNNINDKMALEDIVKVFEKMSKMSDLAESMYLFQTGTHKLLTDTPMFWFSIVRQYPGQEDEYDQLCLNVMYEPCEENVKFSGNAWDFNIEENFFDYIRNSQAYSWAKDNHICKIEIYMDET